MPLTLDDVVIAVADLDRAFADYTALGFTVIRGGEHADGITATCSWSWQTAPIWS